MIDLIKWLKREDYRPEMVKSFVAGKTIAEVAVEFNRPIGVVRYHMLDYMPKQEDIDAFKRKFAERKLKTKRYER